MIALDSRYKKLEQNYSRIFSTDAFDDPEMRRVILGPMPDVDKYIQARDAAWEERDRRADSIPEWLRPTYDQPLLTKAQEQHLFRRYNYHKYRSKLRFDAGKLDDAELEMNRATTVKKVLTSANVRLALPVIRRHYSSRHFEDIISESFFLICRAVDYFDWTRGNKFSTYATWSIQKTMSRTIGVINQHDYRFMVTDTVADNVTTTGSDYEDESRMQEAKHLVSELLKHCTEREQDVIIRRFMKDQTLKEVGTEIGVTKERVRQIESEGLDKIRMKVRQLGIACEVI